MQKKYDAAHPLGLNQIPQNASTVHVVIKRLGQLLDRDQAELLEGACGLSVTQWRILYILATEGAMPQRDLASKTKMGQAHTSRVMKSMAAKGLVSLERDPEDLRCWTCALSPLGLARFDEAEPIMLARRERLNSALTEEELHQFVELASKIARQFDPKETAEFSQEEPTKEV